MYLLAREYKNIFTLLDDSRMKSFKEKESFDGTYFQQRIFQRKIHKFLKMQETIMAKMGF